jgi:hypothetical protein
MKNDSEPEKIPFLYPFHPKREINNGTEVGSYVTKTDRKSGKKRKNKKAKNLGQLTSNNRQHKQKTTKF